MAKDDRVESVMITVADGLTIVRKKIKESLINDYENDEDDEEKDD